MLTTRDRSSVIHARQQANESPEPSNSARRGKHRCSENANDGGNTMPEGCLQFGILGPLELYSADIVMPLGTPKQRAVLAMLVIHRNRTVGVDRLIDAAWEKRPPERARATLHTYVSNLRRLIDTCLCIDARAVLSSAPPGYRLSVADNDCDLGRFTVERSNGFRAATLGRFEQASDHFSAALAQWRGPILEDLPEFTFFDEFATRLEEDKLLTQIAYAATEIACGRPYSAINELKELATEHPYHEPLWVPLITAYYVAERQFDALNACRQLTRSLAEDLGIAPGPTIRALQEQILRQEPPNVTEAAQLHAHRTIAALQKL